LLRNAYRLNVGLVFVMHFIIRRPTDYLYPHERLVEILYGLVIALTITSAVRVITGGGTLDIKLMVTTSLGAGLSWGIIDAMLYILVVMFQKHRYTRIASKISSAKDESEALATIQEDLEDSLVGTLDAEDQKSVYRLVLHAQRRSSKANYIHQPKYISITREDVFGAGQVFFAMLLATLVVVVPLLIIEPPHLAVLTSNIVAFVVLFIVGFSWAKHTNIRKTLFGSVLVSLGVAIVGISLILGG
jgi:VIT1/CCC1 family predicted Fe2+/Mn2+ transporter